MIDMKLPEAGKDKSATCCADEMDSPEYPYGLRLSLDSESLKKLGMGELPAIDAEFKLAALVCVVGVSQNDSQGSEEPHRCVDLQIEMMELSPAKEEPGESSVQRMYPKSKLNP